jgi:predicted GIY-YIG superfamily endonuclease
MFWAYLLLSNRGEFYIGQTQDLTRRLAQHNARKNPRTITAMHGDRWVVVDTKEFQTREEALAYEKRAKRPADRVQWVEENIDRITEIVNRERFGFPQNLFTRTRNGTRCRVEFAGCARRFVTSIAIHKR